jgi:SanA protein
VVAGAAFITAANLALVRRHRAAVFDDTRRIPERDVGLVLGTSPVTRSGNENRHFLHRIEAAAALFHAGKVRHLIVSGDNHRPDYDEPTAMKRALIARGVPADAITCDFAGFRTLDSVVRARTVFGVHACTIVSQRYHNTRALEIARAHGIDAIAYCAQDVPISHSLRTEVREVAARAFTVLDLYLWNRQPRFIGPPEPLRLARRRP